MAIPMVTDGDLVRLKIAVTDTDTGLTVDPSTLAVVYQVRTRPSVSITYGVGGQIVRDGVGQYHVEIDTTGQAGQWNGYVQSTGFGQAVQPWACRVAERPVIP